MRYDVIIIGSGPAGTSVAWPLVGQGRKILLVDAGAPREVNTSRDALPLAALRTAYGISGQKHLLGSGLSALRDVGYASPKLRTATENDSLNEYRAALQLREEGFQAIGAFDTGGLSRIWGAALATFDQGDFGSVIDAGEIIRSYRRVARRIGISGEPGPSVGWRSCHDIDMQPPVPLSSNASLLLLRQRRAAGRTLPLEISRCRVAVSTVGSHSPGDRTCTACRGCMWGCPRAAIYDAAAEIPALTASGTVEFAAKSRVIDIMATSNGWQVRFADGATAAARRVVLAAGVLASTKLALKIQGRLNERVPLLSNPAFSFAALLPSRFGAALPESGFGLAQLSFGLRPSDDPDGEVYGLLYDADTMSAVDLIAHMPLTSPGGMKFVRAILSSLVLGIGYYSGAMSRNQVWLDDQGIFHVQGGVSEKLSALRMKTSSTLRGELLRLGAVLLPGSLKYYKPGAEVHYAGTLPIGRDTLVDGELIGTPGLHVADASTLPRLPSQSHTFTAMANADRIGRLIAAGN
ncbi:FAD-dependent oxidoreductase [Rhodopseudomonas sp.]|uniref:FAD-dependent oxidoreductase n=1 Tax=Rhodopseudomonas sp. TaxID=1078 RepID=UPI0039E41284